MKKNVLMVGWHPDAVNYEKWPGLTPEKLTASLNADLEKLNNLGFETKLGAIHDTETAAATLRQLLTERQFDIVMIGAGVRKDDEHLLIFEQLVNVIHELAPQAKIAFNSGPTDFDKAILRWADND